MYQWLCADGPTYLCRAFAPEHSAEWAQGGIATAALIGIAVGWFLTRQTLAEMRRQTTTLQQQLSFTDRAWLKATATIPRPFLRTADGISLTIQITLENVGRSVAIDVDTAVVLELISNRRSIMDAQQECVSNIIEGTRHSSDDSADKGVALTVFPGEQTTVEWTVGLMLWELEAQQYVPADEPRRPTVSFFIVGAAGYRWTNAEGASVSSFGYDLKHRVASNKETVRFAIEDFGASSLEDEIILMPIPGAFRAD